MKKRLLAFIMALAMLLTLLPVGAMAAEVVDSGTCGENLTWTLDSEGVLTISGTGAMTNYSSQYYSGTYVTTAPWGQYYASIKSVVIGDGVTSIGSYAFYNCSGLSSMTIPDGVTSIGRYVFYGCSRLTSVTIPDGVTSIGDYAFEYCSGLTSVTIPDSVTSIGDHAFLDCSSLTEINYEGTMLQWIQMACSTTYGKTIRVADITIKAFGTCGENLTWTLDSDGVLTISGTGAMTNYYYYNVSNAPWYSNPSTIVSVVIGDGVTSIGDCAFYDCDGLTSVTIGSGVKSIGNSAFSGCSGLTSVTIPDSVTSIGYGAFEGCSGLKSVTIPDSVKSIGNSAFLYCSGLTSVTIPSSVTSIGYGAFEGCSGLKSVTIPDSVESIGSSVFYDCTGLTSVYIHDLAAWCGISFSNNYSNPLCYAHDLYCNGEKVTDLVIPDSVTCIGNSAFSGCSGLTSVTIPSSVQSIGDEAFRGYSNLSHIYFKGSMPIIGSNAFDSVSAFAFYPDGDESYANAGIYGANKLVWLPDGDPEEMIYSGDCGENIVWRLTRSGTLKLSGSGKMYDYTEATQPWKDISFGITSVEISDGIESIGAYAFINCTGLTSVTIGSGVTTIGSEAFSYCTGLTSVTIPDSVTSIGSDAFYSCSRLTSVTIPDSVQSIGRDAFYYCSGLTSVTIPSSVTSIGYGAFYNCRSLTSVTFEGKPAFFDGAFEGVTATAYYYLEDNWPASMLLDYSGKLTWKMLTRHSLDSENLTVLPESVHDYPANYNEKFEIAEDGAVYLTLKFSAETSLGTNDVLFVVDQNGKTVANYAGTEAAGQTLVVDGGKATIRINADEVGSGYGFALDSVKVDRLHHDYSDVVTAPTCTAQGYTTHTCSCGDSYVDSKIPALGHDYKSGKCTRCGAVDPNYKPISFTDVSGLVRAFQESIAWAVANGITSGYDDGTFRPNATCTRGHVVTFLWRAAGCPEPKSLENPFTDVSDSSPFFKAILWAAEQGITAGYDDGTFRPNDACTRAHVVTFLWRYEDKPAASGEVYLVDLDGLNADFTAAIKWAASKNITTGYDDGTFRPNAVCTRAHVVTFLYRDIEK